jgi:hypothetical protein
MTQVRSVMASHPFAKSAKGWGTRLLFPKKAATKGSGAEEILPAALRNGAKGAPAWTASPSCAFGVGAGRMLVMILRGQGGRFYFVAAFALAVLAVWPLAAATRNAVPDPPPTVRIEVGPLGYMAPSRFYLIYRLSSATLDFIDSGHLLFTFRHSGLMTRVPDEPKDDEDQVIRALVIDIASGKVVRETKWRMHDRQAYLWPLSDGKFLVRQRNELFLTDQSLELRPYLHFDTDLQVVNLSPDRNLLMIELARFKELDANTSGDDASKPAPTLGADAPNSSKAQEKWTQVLMFRPSDKVLLAESEARRPVGVPLLSNGFLDALEGKRPNEWMIRTRLFHDEPKTLGQFESACTPTMMTLSESVAFFVGCIDGTGDHAVTAISTNGSVLWRDRWLQRYIWPTFDFAPSGSRFAYGSLEMNHPIGTMNPFDETDVVAQMVGVFDTESGKLELVKKATPILSAGHNYALSADGRRFAILREGAIEVYDLPPVAVPAPAETVARKENR